MKKREFAKGRACIPVEDFWKQMRKSSKNRDGVSLEGTKHEGHGYEPSVLVFGRYDRIQNLLKRKRGINELSAVYAKNIKVHNTTLVSNIDADLACGPFLNAERGYDALFDYLDKKSEVLKRIKSIVRDENGGYIMIFWTVIFILVINYMYKSNTIHTQRVAHLERENSLKNQANSLLSRANDLQRKLDLKKRQAKAAVGLN